MSVRPNDNYTPPVNDPREEGLKHWDQLRSQYMITKDALTAAEVQNVTQAQMIDQLREENRKLAEARELDRNECVSLKTSLHIIGRLVLTVLQRGTESRRNGDPYAPPAGGVVDAEGIDAVAKNIEDLLAKTGSASLLPDHKM